MSEIMTLDQAAAYLRLPPESIRRFINERKLAATQVDGTYRIVQQDAHAFLLANAHLPEVQDASIACVNAIAERNPGMDGDELLEELEREDDERKREASSR